MSSFSCPICGGQFSEQKITEHVNRCLDGGGPAPNTNTNTNPNLNGHTNNKNTNTNTKPIIEPTVVTPPKPASDQHSVLQLMNQIKDLENALHQKDMTIKMLQEELRVAQMSLLEAKTSGSGAVGSVDKVYSTEILAEAYQLQAQRKMRQKEVEQVAILLDVVEKWKTFTSERVEARETEAFIKQLLETEKREREAALERKTYECAICCTDYKVDQIYIVDICSHKFCRDCLQQYLQVKIGEGTGGVKRIRCPSPSCPTELTPDEIKQLVSSEDYAKYERFNLEAVLETIPDLRWCPKPNCKNAMIGDPRRPMMVCTNPSCKFTFCFNCKEEWHADATCEQYQQWKVENNEAEARYQDWVKRNAKPCPKCKAQIEKNGGCNHMTCQKCTHQFCWLCMTDYVAGHFNNEGPCKGKQFT